MPPNRDDVAYHIRRAAAERHAASLAIDNGTRRIHHEMALQHEVARYCVRPANNRHAEALIGATLRDIFSLR